MAAQKKTISKLFSYGYGLGEFGFTFFNFLVAYYLMYYLTDVLCLPMLTAAAIYSAVQWVEVATMLASGIVIDKAQLKGGKYRPWIIMGSVVCAVSTIIFFTDFHLSKTFSAIIFTIAYFCCYCGYNTMWVAYRTLLNPLCKSAKDSVVIMTSASQMSSIAGLVFSAVGAKLLNGFANIHTGYTISAIAYGCLMVVCMLIVAHLVKPYDHREGAFSRHQPQHHRVFPRRDLPRGGPDHFPDASCLLLHLYDGSSGMDVCLYYDDHDHDSGRLLLCG